MKIMHEDGQNNALLRMMFYQLQRELADHLGSPPYYEHIGIINDLAIIPQLIIEKGWRIKGLHISCVSDEYKIGGNLVTIACIIFGDYSNEYHLAYIGDNAGNLDTLGQAINEQLAISDIKTYMWADNMNGKSAHF